MNFKKTAMKIALGSLLILVLAGCSSLNPTPEPTVDLQPTLNAVQTQSAQTVIADLTLNAPTITPIPSATETASPTATLAPTNTVLPSATATNTYIPWTATITPTKTPSAWSCNVTSFSPASNTSFSAGAGFDGSWTIKNVGEQTWTANEVDIYYSSGSKFQESRDAVDLTSDVAPGSSYTIVVDMLAPGTAGSYTTTWVVAYGTQVMCTLTLNIVVQ